MPSEIIPKHLLSVASSSRSDCLARSRNSDFFLLGARVRWLDCVCIIQSARQQLLPRRYCGVDDQLWNIHVCRNCCLLGPRYEPLVPVFCPTDSSSSCRAHWNSRTLHSRRCRALFLNASPDWLFTSKSDCIGFTRPPIYKPINRELTARNSLRFDESRQRLANVFFLF